MLSRFIVTFCCASIISSAAVAEHDRTNPLRGTEFTDPKLIFDMPDTWQQKKLKYQNWAQDAQLAISLDQFLYPFLSLSIQAYAEQHHIKIAMQEGTCGTSAKALKDKAADITGFCCPPAKTDRFPGIKYHTVGIASIALLVNSAVQVEDVSYTQAQAIFQGEIYNWSELNTAANKVGNNKLIHVIGRPHCKQRPGHWRLLLDNEDLFSPRMEEVSTIKDMMRQVANVRGAIGYETLWSLKQHPSYFVKTLSINGVKPNNIAQITAGNYPLYRTYNITTWEADNTKNEHAQNLITYLIAEMEKIETRYGVIPVSRLRQNGWRFHEAELIGQP